MNLKLAFMTFGLTLSASAHGALGMWNQHDLPQGLRVAQASEELQRKLNERLPGEGLGVVRFRRCTGAFVSKTGLLLTSYDCALKTLAKHSTAARDLVKNGFYAAKAADELATDMDFAASITLSSRDVTAEVLSGITSRVLSQAQVALIQERQKKLKSTCEQDGSGSCEVQDISGATRFILTRTLPLKDFKLVFAPPFAAGNRQNKMMDRQGDLPEAAFAVFRSYGGFPSQSSGPTEPPHYFEMRAEPLGPDEMLYVPSYPWRYKRHLGATVMHEAITGGLYDSLSTGFADAIKQAVAEESRRDPRIANLYLETIQGQVWQETGVDELIASIESSKALKELRLYEKKVLDYTARHWSPEDRKGLDRRLEAFRKDAALGAQSTPLGRLTETALMNFLEWAESETKKDTPANPEDFKRQFAEKKAQFDLKTEARILSLTMDMVRKESARAKISLPADVRIWLDKPEPQRLRDLEKLFLSSKALELSSYVPKLQLDKDPLAQLRASFIKLVAPFEETSDDDQSIVDHTYFHALKEYNQAAGLPFYEGEKQKLLMWGFGKVKVLQTATLEVGDKRIATHNFLSSVDVGIRRSLGAPTLDAQGRLVGVFNTLDERDIFLDWYYDEDRNSAIHTGVGTMQSVLQVMGAEALLQELGLQRGGMRKD